MTEPHRQQRPVHRDDGFALLEVLVVLIVLGVLAAIVVLGVSTVRGDAQVNACRTDLQQVRTAADAFSAGGTRPYATAIDDATHSTTTLVGAGYLRNAPAPASQLAYDSATGQVTSTLPHCAD